MADDVTPPVDPKWTWTDLLAGLKGMAHTGMLVVILAATLMSKCSSNPTPGPGPIPVPDNDALISLPSEIKGEPATMIDVAATTAGSVVEWYVDPRLTWRVLDAKNISVVARDKGSYKVIAWTAIKGAATKGAVCSLEIGGSLPPFPPPVPPGPGPQPGPVPVPPAPVKKLYVVVIEDTAQAKANRGAYYANVELVKYLRSKGHILRVEDKSVVDKDGNVPKDLQSYMNASKGMTLPVAFLVDQDGHELYKGPLPVDMLAQIKKVGG